jgi:hypothetical protein
MVEKELDKRFGTIAVKKGFVTQEQLIQAFSIQIAENLEKGEHRLIGAILLDQGIMTMQQIDEVIGMFGKNRK